MSARWALLPAGDVDLHVVPTDDDKPHPLTVDCPCKPRRDPESPTVIIHNSWDHRELLEQLFPKK